MTEGYGDQSAVSLVILDRQAVVHAGIRLWLAGSRPEIKIVGHFFDPAQFMSEFPKATTAVDVVLCALEYDGRGLDFDTLSEICRIGHRVIVYSHHVTDEVILTCLDVGALAYVATCESPDHLCEAIYAARSHTPYVGPRMARALLNDRTVGRPHLSKREKEVLIAWIRTENKELVGRRLFIEPSTVRTHLQRVRAKYAAVGRPAHTKAALIARAVQDGILSIDEL